MTFIYSSFFLFVHKREHLNNLCPTMPSFVVVHSHKNWITSSRACPTIDVPTASSKLSQPLVWKERSGLFWKAWYSIVEYKLYASSTRNNKFPRLQLRPFCSICTRFSFPVSGFTLHYLATFCWCRGWTNKNTFFRRLNTVEGLKNYSRFILGT